MTQAVTYGTPRVADAPVTPTEYAIRVDDSFDALLSAHSGTARPTYAVAGTTWLNTTTGLFYYYDGTTDNIIELSIPGTITTLADADATLTSLQLIGGVFTITPTVARALTVDVGTAIIAAMPLDINGASFVFTIVNSDAFDVTVTTATDVTLVGNNATGWFD